MLTKIESILRICFSISQWPMILWLIQTQYLGFPGPLGGEPLALAGRESHLSKAG